MSINKFELQGRVGYIDIQYAENQAQNKVTIYTKINLGIKKAEGASDNDAKNWDNVFITFFNTSKSNVAERLAETVKKGDYIRCVGKITENRYKITTAAGEEKEKSEIQLTGSGFKKQIYDEMQQGWIDVN